VSIEKYITSREERIRVINLTLPWVVGNWPFKLQLCNIKVLREVTVPMVWKMLLLRVLELKSKYSKFLRSRKPATIN
jgi:hypothetical protein